MGWPPWPHPPYERKFEGLKTFLEAHLNLRTKDQKNFGALTLKKESWIGHGTKLTAEGCLHLFSELLLYDITSGTKRMTKKYIRIYACLVI